MEDKIVYMTIWDAIKAVLVLFGAIIVSPLIISLFPGIDISVANFISYIMSMGLVLIYLTLSKKRKFAYMPDLAPKLRFGVVRFDYVLLSFFLSILASFLLIPYMNLIDEKTMQQYYDIFMSGNLYVTFLSAVVAAPIIEEIIFRGYIFRGLERQYGTVFGILISSLLFAFVHLSLVQSVPAFVTSLIITLVYVLSRYSLSTVIFIHALNNLFAFSQLYFCKTDWLNFDKRIQEREDYNILYVVCVALFVVVLVIMFLFANRAKGYNCQNVCKEEKK